jgi:magnesium chelatase family protein
MTLAILASRALCGAEAPAVRVETHLGAGLPAFTVVGLPDTEVRESRERVRAAIINSGFEFPNGRITVNLSPADLPKASARFDLPIALSVLLASGQMALSNGRDGQALDGLQRFVFAGELSLTGALVPVKAPLALALAVAHDQPGALMVLPTTSAASAAWVPGITVLGADTLADVVAHLTGNQALTPAQPSEWAHADLPPCLSDVRGQPMARRALEIAAAGGHSLLMMGPPGAGKSMLAQRLPGILPPLTRVQALESAALTSLGATSVLGANAIALQAQPPFRSPHHGASSVALIGGGTYPRPGEISLAHHGVLFLDELPEFSRKSLESLREPLESGKVVIARARHTVEFPAHFQLVAAMNPCPCGWRGHHARPCACTPDQVSRYTSKLSGPLLDRLDLLIELPATGTDCLSLPRGESSEVVRERVMRCRARQQQRQGVANAALQGTDLDRQCDVDGEGQRLLIQAMQRLHGSARVTHRVLRVARTIADLGGQDGIDTRHIAEALQFRCRMG